DRGAVVVVGCRSAWNLGNASPVLVELECGADRDARAEHVVEDELLGVEDGVGTASAGANAARRVGKAGVGAARPVERDRERPHRVERAEVEHMVVELAAAGRGGRAGAVVGDELVVAAEGERTPGNLSAAGVGVRADQRVGAGAARSFLVRAGDGAPALQTEIAELVVVAQSDVPVLRVLTGVVVGREAGRGAAEGAGLARIRRVGGAELEAG